MPHFFTLACSRLQSAKRFLYRTEPLVDGFPRLYVRDPSTVRLKLTSWSLPDSTFSFILVWQGIAGITAVWLALAQLCGQPYWLWLWSWRSCDYDIIDIWLDNCQCKHKQCVFYQAYDHSLSYTNCIGQRVKGTFSICCFPIFVVTVWAYKVGDFQGSACTPTVAFSSSQLQTEPYRRAATSLTS